jgi:hypothetical protein
MFPLSLAQAVEIRLVLSVVSVPGFAMPYGISSSNILKYEVDPSGPKTYTTVPVLDHF